MVGFAFMDGVVYEAQTGRWHAMPVMLLVLCVLAIAYRYYSAFLAARVAALDDARETPAHTYNDGQNYHPTNRWVLFGHHFAAISGAGPLIGPVLAIQYGYFPGLLWIVVGVCLAGAVQDMLVLAASVRNKGKSLAEIARAELGPWATVVVSAAILFIVIIALAGLGIVVVKALGGEEVKLAKGTQIKLPQNQNEKLEEVTVGDKQIVYQFPPGCAVMYPGQSVVSNRSEKFQVRVPKDKALSLDARTVTLPDGSAQIVPGSSWGTFTIACTIPIALFVGLYMYKIRKGRVVEASLLGAAGVVAATIIGNWVPGSPLEPYFSLSRENTIIAIMAYGFIASVLPVWLLLCPRDYLSSFLKIGTIALLVIGILVANPVLRHPAVNEVFADGGPTFKGALFPFVFICIMCGAVSGFHALVSSGTTPKMIGRESDVRPIGYGAMLIEGLVGVVALIAAASTEPRLFFEMNTDLAEVAKYQTDLNQLYAQSEVKVAASDPMHKAGVRDLHQMDLAEVEEMVGGESLRGRTGGAVTLAVGVALIFTNAMSWTNLAVSEIMKYWYHFAIMFEALFILTTIDTGTRIARFLLQETMGKVYPKFAQTDWLPSAILSTALVTLAWGALIWTGSVSTIWPMFGIANQLLAVVALALVTTWLVSSGRQRYVWVTIAPMLFVITTTLTAGAQLIGIQFPEMIADGIQQGNDAKQLAGYLSIVFAVFVIACVLTLLLIAVSRWVQVIFGVRAAQGKA